MKKAKPTEPSKPRNGTSPSRLIDGDLICYKHREFLIVENAEEEGYSASIQGRIIDIEDCELVLTREELEKLPRTKYSYDYES